MDTAFDGRDKKSGLIAASTVKFDFEVVHRGSVKQQAADALSSFPMVGRD